MKKNLSLSPIFTKQIVGLGCLALDKVSKIVIIIAQKYIKPDIFREINIYTEKYVADIIIGS